MMFFNSRLVPAIPPSFVKLNTIAGSEITGAGVSTPISDQVPELMNAQSSPLAGTAATADAVSCVAGATTGMVPRPVAPNPGHSGREAGYLVESETILAEVSPHHASALRTKVHGQEGGHLRPPRRRVEGRGERAFLSARCLPGTVWRVVI
jgi:hypothetical protein